MTTSSLLTQATTELKAVSPTPRLDAEVLLAHILSTNRSWLLTHPEIDPSKRDINQFQKALSRRKDGEPIAYITNRQEFFGRTFYVDERVLVPRPESEAMIELLLGSFSKLDPVNQQAQHVIVDVGTGSGALAITAALELPQLPFTIPQPPIYATDIDKNCLAVAKRNAKQHQAAVTFLQGDLLTPVLPHLPFTNPQTLYILANLPYVPDSYAINEAARHEPAKAIFGGTDGLDLYRSLFAQLESIQPPTPNVNIYTESLPAQHKEFIALALENNFSLVEAKELVHVFRQG